MRQSVTYVQNDCAGRIAQKGMQTGHAVREAVINVIDGVWFLLIYLIGTLALFAGLERAGGGCDDDVRRTHAGGPRLGLRGLRRRRSEKRRVGTECVRKGRSRGEPSKLIGNNNH